MSQTEMTKSLAELVTERPERTQVFERLHLDYCCGGSQSLADACAARGLDARTVERLLDALERGEQPSHAVGERDWRRASIGELCDHIVSVHHEGLRDELPRIAELLATVVRVHGEGRPELELTERAFATLRAELEHHLREEEQALFPACRALERGDADVDVTLIEPHEAEHLAVGKGLAALRALAGGYDASQALCSTHRSLLEALRRFEADLHQHVHEENNVLFPRVRELAAGDARLLDTLLDALAALGEAGRPDEANRFAGAAYASLRHRDPGQAQRVNVLMHRLASRSRKRQKEAPVPTADPDLDVRNEPPARRHELIFERYEALGGGEGFVLVNDHDPKPLEYQFAAEHAGQFTWDYLEQGPTVWRVRIGKPAEAAA